MAGPVFFVILPQCDNNPKSMFPCGYYKVSGALYYKCVSGNEVPISVFGWAKLSSDSLGAGGAPAPQSNAQKRLFVGHKSLQFVVSIWFFFFLINTS